MLSLTTHHVSLKNCLEQVVSTLEDETPSGIIIPIASSSGDMSSSSSSRVSGSSPLSEASACMPYDESAGANENEKRAVCHVVQGSNSGTIPEKRTTQYNTYYCKSQLRKRLVVKYPLNIGNTVSVSSYLLYSKPP